MLKFVEAGLRFFFEICLWLILIASVIGGGVWGEFLGISWVIGAFLGACIGAMLDIFWGGLFAILLSFVDNVKVMADGVKGINERVRLLSMDIAVLSKSGVVTPGATVDSSRQTAPSKSAEEFCRICGTRIVPNTEFCTGCGTKL